METPMDTESIIAFLNNRYSESPGWYISPKSSYFAVHGNLSNGIDVNVYLDDLPYRVGLVVDLDEYVDREDLFAKASTLDEAFDEVETKFNTLVQKKIEELEAFKFKKKELQ